MTSRHVALALILTVCLCAAGCTGPSSSTDRDRPGGFYGGITGGSDSGGSGGM